MDSAESAADKSSTLKELRLMTVKQLKHICKVKKLTGYSKFKKKEALVLFIHGFSDAASSTRKSPRRDGNGIELYPSNPKRTRIVAASKAEIEARTL